MLCCVIEYISKSIEQQNVHFRVRLRLAGVREDGVDAVLGDSPQLFGHFLHILFDLLGPEDVLQIDRILQIAMRGVDVCQHNVHLDF